MDPLEALHQDEIQIGPGLTEFDQGGIFRIVVPRPGLGHRGKFQHDDHARQRAAALQPFDAAAPHQILAAMLRDQRRGL
jgi:hypothetical protein